MVRVRMVAPTTDKTRITIRLDDDIVDFFKAQGRGYQPRIHKVLRTYMIAQQMQNDDPNGE